MRLELQPVGESAVTPNTSKWYFEQGRRTLGRAIDCDWQLPQDRRAVSKLHCVIERDHEGFVLRDKSANGSLVDGIVVHEGETARLADRSRLELGGLAFTVSISGGPSRAIEDPEAGIALSDEPLTISAILADISSGGGSASGILGERDGGNWAVPADDTRARHDRNRQGAPSSRNVEIGWSGPPQPETATKLLPDDWYTDGESSFGSTLEHGSAIHVSVPISRPRPVAAAPDPAPEGTDETVPMIARTTGSHPVDEQDGTGASPGLSNVWADRMEGLIRQMEEAMETTFSVFEIQPPTLHEEPDLFGQDRDAVLVARTEALLARQLWLGQALTALMQEANRMMEPRILEARIDARGRRLPWGKSRDYWQAYKAQFEKNGRPLSVREVLRAAMAGETALPQKEEPHRKNEGPL